MVKIDLRKLWQRFIRAGVARAQPRQATRLIGITHPTVHLPATYQAAAQSLVDLPAVQSPLWRNKQLASREHLDIAMAEFSRKLVNELKARGMPFYMIEGYRTATRQAALLKAGRTKARHGAHNEGDAIDVVHLTKAWDLTERQWDVVGLIGKEVARKMHLKVTWGGDWDFYDPAHWQLTEWRTDNDGP